jgi:hypothetical protein
MSQDQSVSASFTSSSSGYRPDALVKVPGGRWIGENVYDPTGASETLVAGERRGATRVFYLVVSNDGTQEDHVYVHGAASSGRFAVRYIDLYNKQDVTSGVVSGRVYYDLPPGHYGEIEAVVSVGPRALVGAHKTLLVSERSLGDPTAVDAVTVRVRVR